MTEQTRPGLASAQDTKLHTEKQEMTTGYKVALGFSLLAPVLYILLTWLVNRMIVNSGTWPAGDDVMYHIYRGEKVYRALKSGQFWVSLDPQWYNGVELLRYWSPLPAYFMALCIRIAGGNAMGGYLVFTALVQMISALSWYIIGLLMKRPLLGMFVGALWFFFPQNLMYYFESGNLAGMLGICCVMPWVLYLLYRYLERQTTGSLLLLGLLTGVMALCHSGFALLAMLVMLFWLLFRKLFDHKAKGGWQAILAVIFGFLLTGVWFLASRRGVGSVDYSEQLRNSFQTLVTTLNPLDRAHSGFAHYYFGLSVFCIAIVGIFFSRKKSQPGFLVTVLTCLLTSTAAYAVIRVLPGGSFLWTSRMICAALAIFLISLLGWKSLRKPLLILMMAVLVLDSIPSLSLIYGNRNGASVSERLKDEQQATLLEEARKIRTQRIALIDGSALGSTGAYLTSTWNGEAQVEKSDSSTQSSFGAGYEAAVTRKNITMLNRAAKDGGYRYLFDRALALGDDTIVIQITQLKNQERDLDLVDDAAEAVGYTKADSNSAYLLYHLNQNSDSEDGKNTYFGVQSTFHAIAIGSAASEIAEFFPAFKEADEEDLSKFSYKELSGYDTIYLDGFKASDPEKAEKLVKKLANHGTRILIAADGMPENRSTNGRQFLGVTCNPIVFQNGYPKLHTRIGNLDTALFPEGSETWNTVYLSGLDQVWGSVRDNGLDLAFYGTKYSDNIVFMGLNLSYFYGLTFDENAEALLSDMMQMKNTDLPKRKIVPLEITWHRNGITIRSDENQVDTTLAYHDIFSVTGSAGNSGKAAIASDNHLLIVNRGTTEIRYRNPYLLPGGVISLAALLALIVLCVRNHKNNKKPVPAKDRTNEENADSRSEAEV